MGSQEMRSEDNLKLETNLSQNDEQNVVAEARSKNFENFELGSSVQDTIFSVDSAITKLTSKVASLDHTNGLLRFESIKKTSELEGIQNELLQLEGDYKLGEKTQKNVAAKNNFAESIFRESNDSRQFICMQLTHFSNELNSFKDENKLQCKTIEQYIEQSDAVQNVANQNRRDLTRDCLSFLSETKDVGSKIHDRRVKQDNRTSTTMNTVKCLLQELQEDSKTIAKNKLVFEKKSVSCKGATEYINRLQVKILEGELDNTTKAKELQKKVNDENTKVMAYSETVAKESDEKMQVESLRKQHEEKLNQMLQIQQNDLEKETNLTKKIYDIIEAYEIESRENLDLIEKLSEYVGNDVKNTELQQCIEELLNLINENTSKIEEAKSTLQVLKEGESNLSFDLEDLINKNVQESKENNKLQIELENLVSLLKKHEEEHIHLMGTISEENAIFLSEKGSYENKLQNNRAEERIIMTYIDESEEKIRGYNTSLIGMQQKREELSREIKEMTLRLLNIKKNNENVLIERSKKIADIEDEIQSIKPSAINLEDFENELDNLQARNEYTLNKFAEEKRNIEADFEINLKKLHLGRKNFDHHYESLNQIMSEKQGDFNKRIAEKKPQLEELQSKKNKHLKKLEHYAEKKEKILKKKAECERMIAKSFETASVKYGELYNAMQMKT